MAERGDSMTIGQRICATRKELGLTQRDISSKGVTHAHISRIEAGTREPSVKALRKIARKLSVPVEWLETGRDVLEYARGEERVVIWLPLDDVVLGDVLECLRAHGFSVAGPRAREAAIA